MHLLKRYFLFFFVIGLLTQCKKDDNPTPGITASQAELLTANNWRVERVTDTNGKAIGQSQLGLQTLVLFELVFQFNTSNIVRATNYLTKQIVNAGDWALADNNTAVDVKVTGFTGKFKIVELTKTTLILQQEGVPVNGVKQTANLVFVPSI